MPKAAPPINGGDTLLLSGNNKPVAVVTYEGKRIEVPQVRVDTQRFYDQECLAAHPEDKQP